MSKNNEIEAKIILPKTIYQKLRQDFKTKSSFYQENYYFDTENGLLKENNISCRIRLFSNHAEQTLKVPNNNPVQKSFHEAIEINDALSLEEAKSLVNKATNHIPFTFKLSVGQYLKEHFDNKIQLSLQTFSKTYRILADGPQGCELTFDDNVFPDKYQDFELEIENHDPKIIQKTLLTLEKEYGFSPNAANTNQAKIARAYKHSGKM